MTLGFLKQGSKTKLKGKMVGLTMAKVQISAMEADGLGEHWPLRSIQDEYLEQVRNSCKSDKKQM